MEPTAVNPPAHRRLRRRWRVPPAIMHGPDEPLESAAVLEEFSGALGVVLWQSLRDVTLWAGTPPPQRGELFSTEAERKRIAALLALDLEPELEQSLGMITAMVGRPGRVSAQRIALACRRAAQWAERHGQLATALAFAQAGALACPGDASAGCKVGQLARRCAEYARAETWFRRAIALARQEGDWASYALAFSGLGNLYIQRGNLPKARSLHTRALRAASRHSLRSIQGDALHDLFVVSGMFSEPLVAQDYARRALEAYGPTHQRVPVLAQDVAYFWLEQGFARPSLRVFKSLRPHMGRAIERLVLLPNTARAAGAAGDRSGFEEAWAGAQLALQAEHSNERYAVALLELARGAASLGEWRRAGEAASAALQTARARREARVEFEAESVLQAVRSESATAVAVLAAHADPGFEEGIDSFAGDLVDSLNVLAAAS